MEPTTLQLLSNKLQDLVRLLRLDPSGPWAEKFAKDAMVCEHLLEGGATREALLELSSSITSVYRGMTSFNDYSPAEFNQQTGRYLSIPGTENFDALSTEVFNLAIDLRSTI